MKNINYFSSNLRFLLKINGYSQSHFGELVGKDRTSIGIYISGTSQPNMDTIIQIAGIFDLTLDQLILQDLKSEKFSHIKTSLSKEKDNKSNKMIGLGAEIDFIVNNYIEKSLNKDVGLQKTLKTLSDTGEELKEKVNYIYTAITKCELDKEIERTKIIIEGKKTNQ